MATLELVRQSATSGGITGALAPKDEKPEPSPSDHWAFKPVVRPPVPTVEKVISKEVISQRLGGGSPSPPNTPSLITNHSSPNPLDAFINTRLAASKLTPLPPAEKPVLLRRVHLVRLQEQPGRRHLESPPRLRRQNRCRAAAPRRQRIWFVQRPKSRTRPVPARIAQPRPRSAPPLGSAPKAAMPPWHRAETRGAA